MYIVQCLLSIMKNPWGLRTHLKKDTIFCSSVLYLLYMPIKTGIVKLERIKVKAMLGEKKNLFMCDCNTIGLIKYFTLNEYLEKRNQFVDIMNKN